MSDSKTYSVIHRIEIYQVDSIIRPSNKWGQVFWTVFRGKNINKFYLLDDLKNNPQIWSYRAMQSFHTTSYLKFVGESIPFCIGPNSFQNMYQIGGKIKFEELVKRKWFVYSPEFSYLNDKYCYLKYCTLFSQLHMYNTCDLVQMFHQK